MKVFFFAKSITAGGAETQGTLIASGLKNAGIVVEYIVYSKANANAKNIRRLDAANIPIHELFWKRPGDLRKMYRLFRANRDGALFAFTSFPNFIGGCIARLAGMRCIYAGIRSENLPPLHMKMERFLNRFIVTKTIFNSYRGRDNFIKLGFSSDRCITVSNAVETIDGKLIHAADLKKPVRIITVGRFIKSKDYSTWLTVIKRVSLTRPDIKAVIIGYGELENQIRSWIKRYDLEGVVEIKLGNGGVNIAAELARADIYLSTTLREGCSNAILEAMRAGLPAVVTDVGDNARMIHGGANGYITTIGDVDGFSMALCKLIDDEKLRSQFGEVSKRIIAEEYSPFAVVNQYKQLIG